jgi:UV DNA damage endonuclease
MFPWASEYELEDLPDFEAIASVLAAAGKYADATNQRLSFHPGQFNCLASEKEHVVQNCLKDLEIHSKIFDLMNRPTNHNAKINIHLGSTCGGNLQLAADNFCRNFDKLSDNAKSRLTVENDDKPAMFSAKFLYNTVYKQVGVPIVFDAHHFELGPQDASYEESYIMSHETWKTARPTFHYSNSKKTYEDESCRVYTAHSDYYYKPFVAVLDNVDVVLEAKAKEKALMRYRAEFVNN